MKMTVNDIPERFRNDPNLIINNGQRITILISEKTGDELAPIMLKDSALSA